MILELLIMKLTMDAILQHANLLAEEQNIRDEAGQLKTSLLKLMADYEAGSIDQRTYSQKEAEIMNNLSKLTRRVTSGQENPQSSFNTGLGL